MTGLSHDSCSTEASTRPDAGKGFDLSGIPCVVVDDVKEDALAILWGLQGAGLQCTPLIYESMSGLLNARVHHLETARIVFLDLNLAANSPGSESTLASHVEQALKELRLAGPYLLVVWSNFNADLFEVLSKVFQRTRDIPYPLAIERMDKELFRVSQDDSWDSSKISARIVEMLERHPQVEALMAWEGRVHAAAGKTTEVLFQIAEKPDEACFLSALGSVVASPPTQEKESSALSEVTPADGMSCAVFGAGEESSSAQHSDDLHSSEETLLHESAVSFTTITDAGSVISGSNLSRVFRAIAKASFGEHAQDHAVEAMESGLLPLLEDRLLAMKGEDDYSNVWIKALGGDWKEDLANSEKGRLNTCLVLDCSTPPCSDRGIWFDFPQAQSNPLKALFGIPTVDLAMAFLQLKTLENDSASPEAREQAKQIKKCCRLGILECSAACDHAWKNVKSRLGLLGAIIPSTVDEEFLRDKDGILRLPLVNLNLPPFNLNNEDFWLLVSFRHVHGLLPKTMTQWKQNGRAIFRVREQMLGLIAARYAAHITRPGTISV